MVVFENFESYSRSVKNSNTIHEKFSGVLDERPELT